MRIEACGVSKRFGAVVGLEDVSFDVPSGRRVALVGPNGSGKSTLNRVLMGLLSSEGEVRVGGRSPFDDRVGIARHMAYVPQVAPQLAARVDELLRAVVRVRGLSEADVVAIGSALELDLPALGPRPFRSLSGGTKQKLLITFAFASGASLLVLDEPTGSLDARARERFFALFERLDARTTLLLCSHRLEEVRPLVEHVLFLEEGRLAWQGTAAAFLDTCSIAQIEAWAEGDVARDWLRSHGFRAMPAGPWLRTVAQGDKMKLLGEMARELGPALHNLNARDLESLDLSAVRAKKRP